MLKLTLSVSLAALLAGYAALAQDEQKEDFKYGKYVSAAGAAASGGVQYATEGKVIYSNQGVPMPMTEAQKNAVKEAAKEGMERVGNNPNSWQRPIINVDLRDTVPEDMSAIERGKVKLGMGGKALDPLRAAAKNPEGQFAEQLDNLSARQVNSVTVNSAKRHLINVISKRSLLYFMAPATAGLTVRDVSGMLLNPNPADLLGRGVAADSRQPKHEAAPAEMSATEAIRGSQGLARDPAK